MVESNGGGEDVIARRQQTTPCKFKNQSKVFQLNDNCKHQEQNEQLHKIDFIYITKMYDYW